MPISRDAGNYPSPPPSDRLTPDRSHGAVASPPAMADAGDLAALLPPPMQVQPSQTPDVARFQPAQPPPELQHGTRLTSDPQGRVNLVMERGDRASIPPEQRSPTRPRPSQPIPPCVVLPPLARDPHSLLSVQTIPQLPLVQLPMTGVAMPAIAQPLTPTPLAPPSEMIQSEMEPPSPIHSKHSTHSTKPLDIQPSTAGDIVATTPANVTPSPRRKPIQANRQRPSVDGATAESPRRPAPLYAYLAASMVWLMGVMIWRVHHPNQRIWERSPSSSPTSTEVTAELDGSLMPPSTGGLRSPLSTPSEASPVSPSLPTSQSGEAPAGQSTVIRDYLRTLDYLKLNRKQQGVWVQTASQLVGDHQGVVPLPAASLTKLVTSLVALDRWGPTYQFLTQAMTLGMVQGDVLRGDLIINGSGDPLFVWESAIALGNSLNQQGIREVTGNLVIVGSFGMNFQRTPAMAGQLLKQGLNSAIWPTEAWQQYQTLPADTPKPQVKINGTVVVQNTALPPEAKTLATYRSLPLAQVLKQLNSYSNNAMAEMLAESLGGGAALSRRAVELAKVPPTEVQVVNGSGLGTDNRLSGRAVCAILGAMQARLQMARLSLQDVLAIAGQDNGSLAQRRLPPGTLAKTGTLKTVSSLAGVVPDASGTPLCFAILNQGMDLDVLRLEQDVLVTALHRHR